MKDDCGITGIYTQNRSVNSVIVSLNEYTHFEWSISWEIFHCNDGRIQKFFFFNSLLFHVILDYGYVKR